VGEPSSPAGLTRFLPRAPAAHPSHPVPARAVCMPACCRPAACTLPSAPRRTIARQVDSLRNARRARCPAAHGLQEQERRFWMMSFIFSCRNKISPTLYTHWVLPTHWAPFAPAQGRRQASWFEQHFPDDELSAFATKVGEGLVFALCSVRAWLMVFITCLATLLCSPGATENRGEMETVLGG
jgi:hypothetical protein